MAHFAKIIDGVVTEVIVAEPGYNDDTQGEWIQTSYNTRNGIHYTNNTPSVDQSKALRKNYAGIGFTYDKSRDAFIPPKPYPNWILNEATCSWNAPVAMPNDGKLYHWNQDLGSWEEM